MKLLDSGTSQHAGGPRTRPSGAVEAHQGREEFIETIRSGSFYSRLPRSFHTPPCGPQIVPLLAWQNFFHRSRCWGQPQHGADSLDGSFTIPIGKIKCQQTRSAGEISQIQSIPKVFAASEILKDLLRCLGIPHRFNQPIYIIGYARCQRCQYPLRSGTVTEQRSQTNESFTAPNLDDIKLAGIERLCPRQHPFWTLKRRSPRTAIPQSRPVRR